MYDTKPPVPRALLVWTTAPDDDRQLARLGIEELQSLVTSIDIAPIDTIHVTLRTVNPSTFIGKGKVAEIAEAIDGQEADLVVMNGAVSPRVQRNLEEAWKVPVMDREEVILRIFASRARTREAKLQVELARLTYQRPRLSRLHSGLSQQRGGGFANRGSGETQLEMDQRAIDEKIVRLKRSLEEIVRQRQQQRSRREKSPVPHVAIIGYTNSGKTSLLHAFSADTALPEDKLFATLDTTTRLVQMQGGESFLLTDTVGFVSDLPTSLVESFKSTLEEALDADLLLIVLDASHPQVLSCWRTTIAVLDELGALDLPRLVFLNKTDKPHDELLAGQLRAQGEQVIPGSVRTGAGLEELQKELSEEIHRLSPTLSCRIPASRWDLVARLRREAQILHIAYEDDGVRMTVRVKNPSLAKELVPFLTPSP